MGIQPINSRIEGDFNGYNDGAIFKLENGQVWQQKRYKYKYKYTYRPHVKIFQNDNGAYFMQLDCMDEPIEVVRVSLVTEGTIVSDFNGFNHNMVFEFQNGQKWEQTESKYKYHYAYRPHAIVVDGINGKVLHVTGMDENVRVQKIN